MDDDTSASPKSAWRQLARSKPTTTRRLPIAARNTLHEKHGADNRRSTLSQFCTTSAKWEVSVKNVELFMYPSLAYEKNINQPARPAQLVWKEEKIYATPQSDYPDQHKLRLDEEEAKRAAFDRKLAFAEKLLREQALRNMDDEDYSSESDDGKSPPKQNAAKFNEAAFQAQEYLRAISTPDEWKVANLNGGASTITRRTRKKSIVRQKIIHAAEQRHYPKKTHLFQKWNRLDSSKLHLGSNDAQSDLAAAEAAAATLSPRSLYFSQCIDKHIVPEPLFVRINSLGYLDIAHFGIGNERAIVLGHSLKQLPLLKRVNFSDNRLTHEAIVVLLNALQGRRDLKVLNLSENMIEQAGCIALAEFVKKTMIKELDLSLAHLTDRDISPLTVQIEVHAKLCVLNLARNQIGSDGGKLIGTMIANSTCCLTDMDISWNRITGEGAVSIGNALQKNASLRKLNLSLNRFGDTGGEQVGAALMRSDCTITELDMSRNDIGDRSTIILAYAITINTNLTKLNLDANPIGTTGARAIISSLARGTKCTIRMSEIDFEVYYSSSTFDKYLPAAHSPFCLDLDNSPYDYVVACELMRASGEYRLCSFHDVSHVHHDGHTTVLALEYAEKKKSMVVSGRRTSWVVPTTGTLNISCTFTPSVPNDAQIIIHEAIPWLVGFIRQGITPREVSSLLEVAVTDIYLTTQLADQILTALYGVIDRVELLAKLLLRIVDGQNSHKLIQKHLQWDDRKRMVKTYGVQTSSFNAKNPGGHWVLDLADRNHRIIVIWLANINGTESTYSKSDESKHGDTSQNGDWNNWRNVKYNGQPVVLDNSFFEALPVRGTLELYYSPTTRPNFRTAKAVSDDELGEFLSDIKAQVCSDYVSAARRNELKYQLSALHVGASGMYFTTDQVIHIMSHFPKSYESCRVKVVYAVFQGIIDLENFQNVLNKLNFSDRKTIYSALGYLNVLNPLRPHMDYYCDLRFSDCRILVRALMDVPLLDQRDTVRVNVDQSDVRTYELYAIASMPTKGIMSFKYHAYEKDKAVATKARMSVLKYFLLAAHNWSPTTNGFS